MQAIILAAGMGKRLREYTKDNTKCMLEVNGVKLIDRALSCLAEINVSRIVLVVGYKGEHVKEYVGNQYKNIPVVYVENPVYDKTNNIYSLFLAKDLLIEDDTLLLESDLIFESSVLWKLVKNPDPNLALVDKYESWMDGSVVTLDAENRIIRFLDKEEFQFDEIKKYYKTVNIYKFSKEFLEKYYVPFLSAYTTALGNNEYYEQVLKVITLLRNAPLKALPLEGEIWYEIDDIQDLDIAEGMFAPTEVKHYEAVSSRYGGYWRYPHMIDFCYLVNPYFPPQKMLDEMKASFETLLRDYPSGMRVNSILASKNFGVKSSYILVGNGAAELIKQYVELYVDTMACVLPSFEEYINRADKNRCIVYNAAKNGFVYSAKDIMDFFESKSFDTLLLVNPDNPSGNYIPFQDLQSLIKWTKNRGCKFIVDESFVDFADADGDTSLLREDMLSDNPHLVVIKSISKSYGVPGLRLGVLASGNTELIQALKKQVAIWNINSFAEFYMQIFEKYHKDYVKACELFRKERNRFYGELNALPFLRVIPSQANYFLCEVTENYTSYELAVKLLKYNVLIKDCSSKKGFEGKSFIRVAVRSREENDLLLNILKSL